MQHRDKPHASRGLVVSDLHLFAARSRGWELIESLRPEFPTVDLLVLNGDIFDFRWSTLATVNNPQLAAIDWLAQLTNQHPRCQIHYVLGNHDCLDNFHQLLVTLNRAQPRFHVHEYLFQSNSALFLHGDCASKPMDHQRLQQHRARWKRDRHFGRLALKIYQCADRLGLTGLIHKSCFPQRRTVARIAHYLDQSQPGWRNHIRHCYFGHTHLPFTNYEHEGILYHNTGSANANLGFAPILFNHDLG